MHCIQLCTKKKAIAEREISHSTNRLLYSYKTKLILLHVQLLVCRTVSRAFGNFKENR